MPDQDVKSTCFFSPNFQNICNDPGGAFFFPFGQRKSFQWYAMFQLPLDPMFHKLIVERSRHVSPGNHQNFDAHV